MGGRLKRSLTGKIIVPLVARMLIVAGCLAWWSIRDTSGDFEQRGTTRAVATFDAIEQSISQRQGDVAGVFAEAAESGHMTDGVLIDDDLRVVASGGLYEVGTRIHDGAGREIVDALERFAADKKSYVVEVESAEVDSTPETKSQREVVRAIGRLTSPVRVAGSKKLVPVIGFVEVNVSDIKADTESTRMLRFLIFGGVVVFFCVTGMFVLRRNVTKRLRQLYVEVTALRGGGSSSLQGYGTDEIGVLASAFRRAFDDAKERNAYVEKTNATLKDEMQRRHAAEAENRYKARHDSLTGLANRSLAVEYLEQSLATQKSSADRHVATLNVNIDRFKSVNDSFGRVGGDKFLKEVARRLLMTVGPRDVVARVSGDEFIVVVDNRRESDVVELAAAIQAAFGSFVDLGVNSNVYCSASIGIATGDEADDAETLLRRAGLALSHSKNNGRARFAWYDEAMQAEVEARSDTEIALRNAIDRSRPGQSELEMHYQPIVDLATGQIRGFESLIRWRRDGVLIPPSDFVRLAEETGLIMPLGAWILKEATAQAGRWQQMFVGRPPTVTINVSGSQLGAGGIPALMRAALVASRLNPRYITVEITESALFDDLGRARHALDELKDLGVKLAIDDFGTGYSSLSYLRRFPIDVVKIDQSFIKNLGDDTQDSTIIAAIVAMARALGLRVVCEGVETAEQVAGLLVLGADDAQGFYFAKALDARTATLVYTNGLGVLDRNSGVAS